MGSTVNAKRTSCCEPRSCQLLHYYPDIAATVDVPHASKEGLCRFSCSYHVGQLLTGVLSLPTSSGGRNPDERADACPHQGTFPAIHT